MMTHRSIAATVIVGTLLVLAGPASTRAAGDSPAVPVESWPHPDDSNRLHFYARVDKPPGISWDDAKTEAEALTLLGLTGWHLATITHPDEQAFVFDTFLDADSNPPAVGYALGGLQSPFPGGDWQWVTGEAWGGYTNWWITEPSGDGPCLEIWSSASNSSIGYWNDYPRDPGDLRYGYLAEIPEPASLSLFLLGGVALLRRGGVRGRTRWGGWPRRGSPGLRNRIPRADKK